MSRKSPQVPLSKLSLGINTYDQEAGAEQCSEALDVYNVKGDLMRRPSFKPIATGPTFPLPAGAVSVVIEYPLATFTNYTNRQVAIQNADQIGGLNGRLWVGCTEPFDGIDWRTIDLSIGGGSVSANKKLCPKYRDSTEALNVIYSALDTTVARFDVTTNAYFIPLCKDGRISWDKSQFTGWTATTLNSLSRYWIALDVCSTVPQQGESFTSTGALATSGLKLVIDSPGVTAFLLEPINGIFANRLRNSIPTVVVCSDRQLAKGKELGGNIGFWKRAPDETENAILLSREGSGYMDAITTPAWTGGSTGSIGTNNVLTKTDQSFKWNINEFDGAVLFTGTATGGSTTSITVALGTDYQNNRLSKLRVVMTSGAANGEEREIVTSTSTGMTVYDAFSGAVANTDTFQVKTRPMFVRTRESGRAYEIASNAEHTATLVITRPYQTDRSALDTGKFVNFEVGQFAPWALNTGKRWSCVYDNVTGTNVLTNGKNGLLEYDGTRLRKLEALWDPTDGVPGANTVQIWTGHVNDLAAKLNNPDIDLGNQLHRAPPNGKYVTDYMGRIVIANLGDREQDIQWSAPTPLTNIWPYTYRWTIRDGENGPITGMWTLNDTVIVSTPNSLHTAGPPDTQGRIIFYPMTRGTGFLSQQGACIVPSSAGNLLIGATADGVYSFDGSAAASILDDWAQVVPGGVNTRMLENAVAGCWGQESLFFLSLGAHMLVYDYYVKAWWLWTCPFGGITAIARDLDTRGKERMLFGHASGHITVLDSGKYDGADTIEWYARSKPAKFDGHSAAMVGLLLDVETMGSSPTLSVKTYVNDSDQPLQSFTNPVDNGAAVYGTGIWATATPPAVAAVWGSKIVKTIRVQLRSAGVNDATGLSEPGHVGSSFQYELRGTDRFRFRGAQLIMQPKGQRSQL
jgi:hypothetical protein